MGKKLIHRGRVDLAQQEGNAPEEAEDRGEQFKVIIHDPPREPLVDSATKPDHPVSHHFNLLSIGVDQSYHGVSFFRLPC